MKESDFCLEIKHSIEQIPGTYYHKIPDQARFLGEGSRFAPVRPYDCYAVHHGIHFAFEVKLHKGTQAFPVDSVKLWQITALLKVQAAKGVAGLVIGYRAPMVQVARYVPIDWWISEVNKLVRYEHRKSFPVASLLEMGYSIRWLGKGLWNFEDLLFFLDPRKKA